MSLTVASSQWRAHFFFCRRWCMWEERTIRTIYHLNCRSVQWTTNEDFLQFTRNKKFQWIGASDLKEYTTGSSSNETKLVLEFHFVIGNRSSYIVQYCTIHQHWCFYRLLSLYFLIYVTSHNFWFFFWLFKSYES